MSFKCGVCNRNFTSQAHLEAHLLKRHNAITARHVPSRIYECPFPGCTEIRTTQKTLYLHFIRAHNGRVFESNGKEIPAIRCTEPNCRLAFLHPDSMRRHRNKEHRHDLPQRGKRRSRFISQNTGPNGAGPSEAPPQASNHYQNHESGPAESFFNQNASPNRRTLSSRLFGRSGRQSGSKSLSQSQGTNQRHHGKRKAVGAFQGTALQRQFEQDVQGSLLARSEQDFLDDLDAAFPMRRRKRGRKNRESTEQQQHDRNAQNSYWDVRHPENFDELLSMPRSNRNQHGHR